MSIKQRIRNFIMENFLFTDDESVLYDGTSFIAQGIIDSIGVMEIVEFVEGNFGIKVNADEILPDNFDSVDNLVAFVEHKRSFTEQVPSDF